MITKKQKNDIFMFRSIYINHPKFAYKKSHPPFHFLVNISKNDFSNDDEMFKQIMKTYNRIFSKLED